MELYGEAIRKGLPSTYSCSGKDILLMEENSGRAYYFCHEPGIAGHDNVTQHNRRSSPRCISDWNIPVHRVFWMDNNEELAREQQGNSLIIHCTGFPYGENHVMRVAVITYS
ncbi:MAG: hypothetical protein ACR2PY_08595, partial [Salinispira sp.]